MCLSSSIGCVNLYRKQANKTTNLILASFCRCKSKGNTDRKGWNALFDTLLWLPLLPCTNTEEGHHHFMLTATGCLMPVLTQSGCHGTVAVCKLLSRLLLYPHACDDRLWLALEEERMLKVSYLVFRFCLKYIIKNQDPILDPSTVPSSATDSVCDVGWVI